MEDMIIELSNGVKVINTSPHPFTFEDGTVVPPCGTTLNATFEEVQWTNQAGNQVNAGSGAIELLQSRKVPQAAGLEFVQSVPSEVLILGSAIAAEAYGYPVVMAKPTAETAGRGTPPADKRMRIAQFTAWGL